METPRVTSPADPPGEEEVAEAREAILRLARAMGRASAAAAHRLGIDFDMDDPQVARDVMMATFEGLFLSGSRRPPRKRGKARGREDRRKGGAPGPEG